MANFLETRLSIPVHASISRGRDKM